MYNNACSIAHSNGACSVNKEYIKKRPISLTSNLISNNTHVLKCADKEEFTKSEIGFGFH